jgi:hypothetical protein
VAAVGEDLGEALDAVLLHCAYIGTTQGFPERFQPAWTAAILPEGLAENMRELLDSWDQVFWFPREVHDLGRERYLLLIEAGGRGRSSGVRLDGHRIAHLVTLREGKAERLETYLGWDAAREAAGLA